MMRFHIHGVALWAWLLTGFCLMLVGLEVVLWLAGGLLSGAGGYALCSLGLRR